MTRHAHRTCPARPREQQRYHTNLHGRLDLDEILLDGLKRRGHGLARGGGLRSGGSGGGQRGGDNRSTSAGGGGTVPTKVRRISNAGGD